VQACRALEDGGDPVGECVVLSPDMAAPDSGADAPLPAG
jgi:hypothetical protein